MSDFLRYLGIFACVQFALCVVLWTLAITLRSDIAFGAIIYFYWPIIMAFAAVVNKGGESSMIAIPIFGMLLGNLTYSAIAAGVITYLKRRRVD